MIKTTDNEAFAAKPVRPTPTPVQSGTISDLQVYWNTFMPTPEDPKTIFNMDCPTGMVAISGGAKTTWERINTYPIGDSIKPSEPSWSGVSLIPATGWGIELSSEPTAPLTGFVVCGKVN